MHRFSRTTATLNHSIQQWWIPRHFSSDTRTFTYLTDVEGDKAYLERYVEQSKILDFRDSSSDLPYDRCIDFTDPNGELIFGGDMWDKGGHDLYCIRQLLDLKRRYPARVHFIMGNRDLNKLRILNELGIDKLPPHRGVYYLSGTGRPGDPLLENAGISQTCPVKRLKWILRYTMGSPHAFKLRKAELESELMRSGKAGSVTDDDVVKSYRRSCHPTGEMGQYLHQAHLALKLGSLFVVHGALPFTPEVLEMGENSIWSNFEFAMPWRDPSKENRPAPDNILDWMKCTKSFAEEQLRSWAKSIAELEISGLPDSGCWAERGGYHFLPSRGNAYSNLMQYGYGWTPNGKRNRTVVYNSWQTNGMPRRFFPSGSNEDASFVTMTSRFFDEAEVQIILSGHQPSGDMPTPIRIDNNKMIICCDTSYSGDTNWVGDSTGAAQRSNPGRGANLNGRGSLAVSEVLIEQCQRTGKLKDVQLHGVLSDGSKYEMRDLMRETVVGQVASTSMFSLTDQSNVPRDWWVKARLDDGDNGSFLISSAEGYTVWNRIHSTASTTSDDIVDI